MCRLQECWSWQQNNSVKGQDRRSEGEADDTDRNEDKPAGDGADRVC